MSSDMPRQVEFTPLAGWVRAITWGVVAIGVWTAVSRPPGDGAASSVIAAGILVLGVLFEAVLGGLQVTLYRDRVRVSLGRVGWIRKTIPYADIATIEPVTYRPLRDFGGWGVRGFGARQAWTASGNRALVLHRVDGTEIYVGSDQPERLAERLRSVARRPFRAGGEAAG